MNSAISFTVKMQNLMSSELTKLSYTATSTFGKISKHIDQVKGRNKILDSSFSELSKRISETESTIKTSNIPSQIAFARRELSALQKQANNHKGNVSGGLTKEKSGIGIGGVAIGSMLGGIYTKALGMITAGAGSIIEESFKKETAITGLKTFLGEKGANDAYKNIRQDASINPFDTESLLQVNRALISAGENATNARSTSLDLANAVSAVGGGNAELSRMAANLQQIKTVGKATAMDIRQFGMAGINIYEMLARSTGKNINQVKEMDVTYEMLQKSLAMSRGKGGIYEGAMEAQSNTSQAKWNTLKDTFKNTASDIGVAFSPLVKKLLDLGVNFANSISSGLQRIQPYIDYFANGFSQIVDYISDLTSGTSGWSDWLAVVQQFVMNTWVFIKQIAVKLWNLVSSIIEFVKNSEILKDIFSFIGWIFEKVYNIINYILTKIIWLWENIIKPMLTAIDSVYKWIKGDDGKAIAITATKKTVGLPAMKSGSALSENSRLSNTNTSAGKSAGETVVGGGQKTININVGKFFENIQFTTMNGTESAEQLEKVVLEALGRVLYNGSKLV